MLKKTINYVNVPLELMLKHSIDSVIFGFEDQQLKILLIKYKYGDFWSLPGGFIYKDENMDNAAHRILEERTGLKNTFLNQFYTFGDLNRNVLSDFENNERTKWAKENIKFVDENFLEWANSRFITTGYLALIDIKKASPKPDEFGEKCEWCPINEIPKLLYDHGFILQKALEHVKLQLNYLPIGISLLPEKFTMQDLQKLYEDILNTKLERSNFQRKILKLGIFIRLEKQFTGASNKAPYLYCFDEVKYNEVVKNGIGFSY